MSLRVEAINWRYTLISSVWLVFLWFPLNSVLTAQEPLWLKVAGIVELSLFALLNISAYLWPSDNSVASRVRISVTFGLMLLLTGLLTFSAGADAMSALPFLVSFSIFCFWPEVRYQVATITTVGGLITLWLTADRETAGTITWPIIFVLTVGITVTSLQDVADREYAVQRENLVIRERDKMARDVHDLIGHSLTLVALKAQVAERLIDANPGKAKIELAEIRAITAEALEGVRSTVSEARTRSLRAELDSIGDALQVAGVGLRIVGDQADIPTPVRDTAAWIARESATNVLRHSGATLCLITLSAKEMAVEDNGKGAAGPEGAGISGMRKRALSAGAKVSIGESDMGGVKVQVRW